MKGEPKNVKSELLKDILAFANTLRRSSAYILIGVDEVKGGRSKVVGVQTHLDDAKLQQFVNSKTQQPVEFAYFPFPTEGVEVGIIEIPVQERPIYLKKAFGKLEENTVYIRRGSSTMTAALDEIAQMRIESERLVSGVTPQPVPESADSNESLQKQDFKSSFFELLKMHSEIVNSIVIRKGIKEEYFGQECFDHMLRSLKNKYNNGDPARRMFWDNMSPLPPDKMKEEINVIYEEFFAEYQPYVGPYFRHLYQVVKLVDQSDFLKEFEAKKFYTNLIRAQLSSDELGLFFYNCLSDRGAKFKDLVEKYALFKDMSFEVLLNAEHRNLYAPGAYGESG